MLQLNECISDMGCLATLFFTLFVIKSIFPFEFFFDLGLFKRRLLVGPLDSQNGSLMFLVSVQIDFCVLFLVNMPGFWREAQ